MAYVAEDHRTSATATLTFTDPSSTGQLLVCGVCIDGASHTYTTPSGWIAGPTGSLSAVDGAYFAIFYKLSSLGGSASVSFVADSAADQAGCMVAYSGIAGLDVAGSWNLVDSGGSSPYQLAASSITTANANALGLWFGLADSSGSYAGMGCADQTITSAGATGTVTGSCTSTPGNYSAPSGWTLRSQSESGSLTGSAARAAILLAFYAGPTISAQPSSTTVNAGETATFSVTASGSGSLTYQWKLAGSNISGATSSSYTTPAVALADGGGSYTCAITDSNGTVTSAAAILTVRRTSTRFDAMMMA